MGTLTIFGIGWKADKSDDSKSCGFLFNIKFFSFCLTLREAIFMGHVPWLGSIALSLPGFANNTKVFSAHAKSWARRRVKEGSTHKDLFYHLVRLHLYPDHQLLFYNKLIYLFIPD